jgi:hypothetical protein
MHELEVAKAIRDGELTSPQRVENMTLFDIRITGTGFSYRPKLKEWVYRRDGLYLTPEFLQRCNGLPVIWEHPGDAILDSKEFANRVVGTVILPYIRASEAEVWAIAKVFDEEAITLLEKNQMSTSPSVVFRDQSVNYTIELADGESLLVEGKPSLVDHVAICEQGVWDKDQEPRGIAVAELGTLIAPPDDHPPEPKADALFAVADSIANLNRRVEAHALELRARNLTARLHSIH